MSDALPAADCVNDHELRLGPCQIDRLSGRPMYDTICVVCGAQMLLRPEEVEGIRPYEADGDRWHELERKAHRVDGRDLLAPWDYLAGRHTQSFG